MLFFFEELPPSAFVKWSLITIPDPKSVELAYSEG